jgi:uncharacterized repeat protein (TIGR01451 family)
MTRSFSTMFTRLTAVAAALISAGNAPLHAQTSNQAPATIANTATIEWDIGSNGRTSRPSNPVVLQVEPRAPQGAPTLETFQTTSGSSGQPLSVPQTMCMGNGTPTPITLHGIWANIPTSPAMVRPATEIRAGAPLVLSLTSAVDNRDPNAVETKMLRLTTQSGDSETLQLTESGANTGVFIGIINTTPMPPAPVQNNCALSVTPGEVLNLTGSDGVTGNVLARVPVNILIDPFGITFDSGDATPVSGTRVTIVDAATGQPATVYGDDGVSIYPSSMLTGATVTDSGGASYSYPVGEYRFPFLAQGSYRLVVNPPTPYTAPSNATPADLTNLRRPDGGAFVISDGSYSLPFVLNDPAPVRIDIPLDRPGAPIELRKTASQPVAQIGDALQYRIVVRNPDNTRPTGAITINDTLPEALRLRTNTVRYNGQLATANVAGDGRSFSVALPPLRAGGSGLLTYVTEVRPDARPGTVTNKAQATDNRGIQSPVTDAMIRITRETISDRMTIIGRITEGGCFVDPRKANGIPGVRVMLEDGSYAVTDKDGRYHFEGVIPGLHVVQMDPATLPAGQVPVDCARNARSGKNPISRFVEGQGGALLRVDFRSMAGENTLKTDAAQIQRAAPVSDQEASGATINGFEDTTPGVKWLFPGIDHNPRTKSVRIMIKHGPDQNVRLTANGKAIDPVAFEGARKSPDETVAVSIWRGLPLENRNTVFKAEVLDANGAVVETLTRNVHFSASPIRAEFVKSKSVLVADGVSRPVIAIRLLDRDGRPAHKGVAGDFQVSAPYTPAVEADAQTANQLSGLERARPVWHVEGDDGIAYIELEPTTTSGTLTMDLPLRDGEVARKQRLELWLDPGKRAWTVVGFAAGTVGFNTLDNHKERLLADADRVEADARLALYAKGRIKGKWLMTMSYDSDKAKADTRFGSVIDPQAYYTIYADRSERRYDASSIRKLYLKLERPQFYALFGDYETGIFEPQLTRYVRAFNGVKTEYRGNKVGAVAFAADTPFRHRREEIQGNGLSGPYPLGARDILPNSERITIETRDRIRGDRIVESRTLTRNIDYDIDYIAGTLRFREPVLSRSLSLDPQFIVVDYEVDGVAQRVTNAGGRVTFNNEKKTLQIGATGIHNEDDRSDTNLGGVDVRFRPSDKTEIRAEFAASDQKVKAGSTLPSTGTTQAWLVEAEHHSGKVDVLAYARAQEAGFGVGQTNGVNSGSRKVGVDARGAVSDRLSVIGSAWHEDYLDSAARRTAARGLVQYRGNGMDVRAGLTHANDRLLDGRTSSSTIAQIGVSRRFFNKLELDAQTEFSIAGKDEVIDVPARHSLGARYKLNDDIMLVGTYEIAKSDVINARTAKLGFDVKPWTGARITSTLNNQDIDEYGPRTYAAFGLAQSLPVTKRLTVDFTVDANKTLSKGAANGVDETHVLNPLQPVSSGGFIGSGGLTEDFTAVTAGATYRSERWSWTGRAEARQGSLGDRYGLTAATMRQIGEGRAFGGQVSLFRANSDRGVSTETASLAVSWANRPDNSRFAFLEKLELRSDIAKNAIFGEAGPIGGAPLLVDGNVKSKRIINSLSVNWSPTKLRDEEYLERSEVSFFWGSRYVFDKFGEDDLKGWSNVFGTDMRFDLSKTLDVGFSGTVRQNPSGSSYSYSAGPTLSVSPIKNSYITIGYNMVGFRDKDFEDSRYTRKGPFISLKMKFDQNSFAGLGLGR